MANDWIDENDEPITTGAKNNLKVEENGKLTELGIELDLIMMIQSGKMYWIS